MVTERFGYLLDRIRDAEFTSTPFPHLSLNDFLTKDDFDAVVDAPEIRLPPAASLDDLFDSLDSAGYEAIRFPGCTTSREEYVDWIERASKPRKTHEACQAQGMTLRLRQPRSEIVRALDEFFRSPVVSDTLRQKFGISDSTSTETGVQKYLHGYEISPHPDIRLKALTWMLNINPAPDSEALAFHTDYLELKPEWSFVSSMWEHNPDVDTCWLPWDWCRSVTQQRANNSIVIFRPRWDTMHAIRAYYDHLATQRTQFYGNLWYDRDTVRYQTRFSDFEQARGRGSAGPESTGRGASDWAVRARRLVRTSRQQAEKSLRVARRWK